MTSHILVLGATGPTGLDFCRAALQQGHKLTLYVRNPDKLPAEVTSNPNVSVVNGTLEDKSQWLQAAACGATIFVSFAGPTLRGAKGTPITDAMKSIFPLLVASKFRRALILGTLSFKAPRDTGGLKWTALITFIKLMNKSVYDEFSGLGAFVTSQDLAALKWTLFRVPFLNDGPASPVKATFTGVGDDGMYISRKSIASWVLSEIGEDSRWVGEAPLLCN
ncbi:hypothetical protein IFM5058_09996 [Aspergillus udagawae]|nr:hypothetical protein IFM5058_09996 [Aspergillus udagawae]